MFDSLSLFVGNIARPMAVFLFAVSVTVLSTVVYPQGASSITGNGGSNTIRGRIYIVEGRRSPVAGLSIRLKSTSTPDITVFSDETGSFVFRNLSPGSYTIVVEGGESFENSSERVMIDDMGSSGLYNGPRLRLTPQVASVQIFLKPLKKAATRSGVLNVRWAAVPKEALDRYDTALRLIRENQHAQAEGELKEAIKASPGFSPAHTALGRVLQRTGRLDEAVEQWKMAIRYDESDFDAHLNLGIAYLNLKKLSEAESEFVSAALLDQTAVSPHYHLGLLFVVRNDLAIAQTAFEKARQLDAGNTLPAIHKYLGRVYSTNEMPKEAIKELETYLALVPQAPDAAKVRQNIADIRSRKK